MTKLTELCRAIKAAVRRTGGQSRNSARVDLQWRGC